MLLWSLDETAKQLAVSKRTVRRLIDSGQLPVCHIGRLIRVPADAVAGYVEAMTQKAHNLQCVESVAWKGNSPCHIEERTRRTGGSNTPTQAASKLTAVLAQLTSTKQRHSKQNGG